MCYRNPHSADKGTTFFRHVQTNPIKVPFLFIPKHIWHNFCPFYTKSEQFLANFLANLPQKCIFFAIYLVIPQKSSTFAEDYVWIYV